MSWLSELFGGGGGEDPRAVQQRQQQAAEEEQKRQEEAAAQQQLFFQQILAQQAADTAQAAKEREAQTALQQQQADQQRADALAASAPTEADKQEQALQLQDLADERARKELRRGATGQVNQLFQPEFEQTWAPGTADDPYIQETLGKERGKADEYLGNLLKRGVITDTGYKGGVGAIEEQVPNVQGQLTDIGDALIEAQRGKLTGLADRARNTASTLDVGQTFDPTSYDKQLHDVTADFGAGFGGKFNAAVPEDLFDFSKIQQKAGAAQGAQNLAFDPGAVAGDVGSFGDVTEDLTKKKKTQVPVF
jgi:hypothetical protein